MAEYISRDKAREIIENQQKAVCYNGRWGRNAAIDVGKYDELEAVLDSIDAIPAAEVEPVRHGRWIDKQEDDLTEGMWRCSACGEDFYFLENNPSEYGINYCVNCGARMDGRQ